MMRGFGSMSEKMATLLKIAGASRMNIVISGGTGSGKTTMLNALSKMIDPGERVLTIEDAAELRLQQPHWLPLETRPPNLEGQGAITIRDLVINALRMRPDRIILGEIRGPECFDLLAAMNTGHDGSMATLHSNSPRECLARMENMVMMSDIKVPKEAISRQIADSVDLIVQVKRLRDGSRRTTNITEVIGMEGDVIVTQELFKFEYLDESADGKIIGEYRSMGLRPYTLEKGQAVRLRPALSRILPVARPGLQHVRGAPAAALGWHGGTPAPAQARFVRGLFHARSQPRRPCRASRCRSDGRARSGRGRGSTGVRSLCRRSPRGRALLAGAGHLSRACGDHQRALFGLWRTACGGFRERHSQDRCR
jgi:CBS domain-containing protein